MIGAVPCGRHLTRLSYMGDGTEVELCLDCGTCRLTGDTHPTPTPPDQGDLVERVKSALLSANVNAPGLENIDALARAAIATLPDHAAELAQLEIEASTAMKCLAEKHFIIAEARAALIKLADAGRVGVAEGVAALRLIIDTLGGADADETIATKEPQP